MKKKQSLKKFFFLLGTWFVLVLAIIVGSALYDRYKTSEHDGQAVPYIKRVVPELSQWDPAKTKALMAVEIAQTIPDAQFEQAMNLFSKLGSLQEIDDPQFIDVHTGEQAKVGAQTIVEYDVEAEYANGEATINLKLLLRDGLFEVYSFNFSSETLLQ